MNSAKCMASMYTPCTFAVKALCTWSGLKNHGALRQNVHMTHPRPSPKKLKLTFIRQWRKHRGLTVVQLADRVRTINEALDTTHASISRIERGLQPYSQEVLEAIAEALLTTTANLLMRDPTDPDGIWSVWDQAKQGERRQIVEVAKTLLKTGTGR